MAINSPKVPLAYAAPTGNASLNPRDPILFIHGFSLTSPVDCQSYGRNNVENYIKAKTVLDGYTVAWNPAEFETIGYYKGYSHCDINLNYGTDIAAVVAQHKCANYFSRDIGTTSEPIKHLGCELAWFI